MLCKIQANQSNCSPLKITQSTLNKDVIKITNAGRVALMKPRNWFFNVERKVSIGKKSEDGDNRFWLTSKCCLWFNKVVLG